MILKLPVVPSILDLIKPIVDTYEGVIAGKYYLTSASILITILSLSANPLFQAK